MHNIGGSHLIHLSVRRLVIIHKFAIAADESGSRVNIAKMTSFMYAFPSL